MINCSNTFTDNLEQLWNFPPSPTELCGRGYHSIHKWDYWNPYINRCTTHNDYKGLTVEVGRSLQNLGHDVSTRGCRNIKNIHERHYDGMCSSSLPMCCNSASRKYNLVMLIVYETVTTNHF